MLLALLPPSTFSQPLDPIGPSPPADVPPLSPALTDLHTHTTQSDGTLSPLALVRAAHAAGITVLALTDHDQLSYEAEALDEAERLGLTVIRGVEISTEWKLHSEARTVKAHLLGYFVRDERSSGLYGLLSDLREKRHARNLAILEKLKAQDIVITPQQLVAQKSSTAPVDPAVAPLPIADATAVARLDYVGRPHFARVLVAKGYVASLKEAFVRYLSDEQLQLPEWSIDIDVAIRALHTHGGVSVLAHPSSLNLTVDVLRVELAHLLRGLHLPLTGLEAYSSRHSLAQAQAYAALAAGFGLLVTGGSDFHGTNKVNVPIGRVGGGHAEWTQRSAAAVALLRRSRAQFMSEDEFEGLALGIALHFSTYLGCLALLLGGAWLYERELTKGGVAGWGRDWLQKNAIMQWLYGARDPPASLPLGSPRSRRSPLAPPVKEAATRPTIGGSIPVPLHFLFCFVGLQVSYLTWGYLQERIMTGEYDNGSVREAFGYSEFLVFSNRLSAAVFALSVIAYRRRRQAKKAAHEDDVTPDEEAFLLPPSSSTASSVPPPAASPASPRVHSTGGGWLSCPPYKFVVCSLSNVLSTWFQYESLHFVSFPLQVLSKSSKVLFTMLMGRLVARSHYSLFAYLQAAFIAIGLVLFRYSEAHHDTHRALPPFASALGIGLLLGYMVADSFTSTFQGRLFREHKRVDELEMMAGVNLFSCALTVGVLSVYGGLLESLAFGGRHADFVRDAAVMSVFSAAGQLFIYHTIAAFGPVAFASIMTLRQLLSLVLSVLAFGHPIGMEGVGGLTLVFTSLALKVREDVTKGSRKGGDAPRKGGDAEGALSKEKGVDGEARV